MKGKSLVTIKNVFCIITVLWSVLMLFEYTLVLTGVPDILFEVSNCFLLFLYSGIFGVPILFLVSAILMAVTGKKYEKKNIEKILNVATVVLPVIVGVIMLLTDFNSRLQ